MVIQQGLSTISQIHLYTSTIYLQGYEYREAVDGHEGVRSFEGDGRFEYVSLTD